MSGARRGEENIAAASAVTVRRAGLALGAACTGLAANAGGSRTAWRTPKPKALADTGGTWCGNALRFATKEEAHVTDLARRWTSVPATRVIESDDEPNAG
jgi:hypothetical protein